MPDILGIVLLLFPFGAGSGDPLLVILLPVVPGVVPALVKIAVSEFLRPLIREIIRIVKIVRIVGIRRGTAALLPGTASRPGRIALRSAPGRVFLRSAPGILLFYPPGTADAPANPKLFKKLT